MKSIYLTFTPYHILLSCAIAINSDNNTEKEIIIFKDFVNADKFAVLLHKWKSSPFDRVTVFEGTRDVTPYKAKYKSIIKLDSTLNVMKRNISAIKKYFKKNKTISKVFTFHDGRLESQIAEYLNHKRGGENIYIEDGTAVYTHYTFPRTPVYIIFFNKLYYGPWSQFIRFHGDYKYTDKIMVLQPDLVRKELKDKPIEKISREALLSLKEEGLTNLILDEYHFPLNSEIDILIILPHSEFLQGNNLFEEYIDIIKKILQILEKENASIFVKYHPREKDYYLKFSANKVEKIPQGLPLELLYLHLIDNPPRIILGDISTALLTGKLILEETNVISILKILDVDYYKIADTFKKADIMIPRDTYELKNLLEILFKSVN